MSVWYLETGILYILTQTKKQKPQFFKKGLFGSLIHLLICHAFDMKCGLYTPVINNNWTVTIENTSLISHWLG